MRRSPPDLLVTTPESLYLLLTAPSSRAVLGGVHTVIVDEVHTLARDKRGAHLALTLERLDQLVVVPGGPAATDRALGHPAAARGGGPPAVGGGSGPPARHHRGLRPPTGPRRGHRAARQRARGGGQRRPAVRRPRPHRRPRPATTAPRWSSSTPARWPNGWPTSWPSASAPTTRDGGPRSGDPAADGPRSDPVDAALQVAAHHGSLSAARRRIVEQRLRAGDLRALVATASLELGIDVGPVELVCQIGSPRAIGTFLQRVGRANHQLDGTPAGRLYPLTRDELVECTALLAGVRAGHLDLLHPPVAPLDVLAQQLVAEVAAAEEWEVEAALRTGPPGRPLRRPLAGDLRRGGRAGVAGGSRPAAGRRGAHLHHDAVNGRLRARRGARLAALTSGGAIPETGRLPGGAGPRRRHRGLGARGLRRRGHRRRHLPAGHPLVAGGQGRDGDGPGHRRRRPAAHHPVLAGRGPGPDGRALRGGRLPCGPSWSRCWPRGDGDGARALVRSRAGVSAEVADQVVAYLAAGLAALGALPTRDRLVVERCLRRQRGDPAHRPLPLRGPHQPGPRTGPAQALLRVLRLRAAGGGRRRHRRALPRAPAQLPAVPGAHHAPAAARSPRC